MIEDNSLGLEFKYLIVNDMDRKFGLWVNTVGYQSIPPDSPYPLKEHPSGYFFNAEKGRVLREYQLVYITKGRGLFSSDSTSEKQVCKGRLMVLFPGQWHTYYPLRQTGWTEYYIGFEGPTIDAIVGDAFLSRGEADTGGWNKRRTGVFVFSCSWRWRRRIKYLPSNTCPALYST